MRSSQRIYIVYFLSLITAFVCAGCGPQAKPVVDVAPAPSPPIEQPAEEYPDNEYVAGDDLYPEGYYIHTVSVPNENISIIAKWYTGLQKSWVILAKCNPNLNPNLIFLGNRIKIPRSIITRHTQMPAEFVRQSHTRVKKKTTPKAPVPQIKTKNTTDLHATEEKPTKPEEEEPMFFGPKGY